MDNLIINNYNFIQAQDNKKFKNRINKLNKI